MRPRDEIERVLLDEVDRTKNAHDEAGREFKDVMSEIPSCLPYPNAAKRIRKAGSADASTLVAYIRALEEFNAFVIHGVIPARLRPPESLENSRTITAHRG